MEKNIVTLSRWLINKGLTSILKIEKLLFFIRVEELKNNKTNDSYFKEDKNFQAWMYGPVSRESFDYLQPWFNKETEPDTYFLSEEEEKEIDKKYLEYFNKYNVFSPSELVDMSHKNLAWIKTRGTRGANEVCSEFMIEDENFIKFK